MILGTFWSEKDQGWVRFVEASDKTFKVQFAKAQSQSPTASFVDAEDQNKIWQVDYELGKPTKITKAYQILNKRLYVTDGSINLYTSAMEVRRVITKDQEQPNRDRQVTPFLNFKLEPGNDITEYSKLPLTPEEYQAQELTREKVQLTQQQRWQQIQSSDIRTRLCAQSNVSFSSFNIIQHSELLRELNTAIPDLQASKFESPTEYVTHLETIVQNPNDENYKKLYELASKTVVFDNPGLRNINSDSSPLELATRKLSFYLGLLVAEANHIRNLFGMAPATIQFTLPNPMSTGQDESTIADDPDGFLGNVDEATVAAQAALLAAYETQAPQMSEADRRRLKDIQDAVTKAQQNYYDWWYKGKDIRGPNGWFTFFRHGRNGQIRATEMFTYVTDKTRTLNEVVTKINDFIDGSSTRWNNHSFASFLMDELLKKEGALEKIHYSAYYKPSPASFVK